MSARELIIKCAECDGTGRWFPPGQDLPCVHCGGVGHFDLSAEYLCDIKAPRQVSE